MRSVVAASVANPASKEWLDPKTKPATTTWNDPRLKHDDQARKKMKSATTTIREAEDHLKPRLHT